MTAILRTRSAKTCWPSCASICAGPWTSLFSCCPQTISSVRILSKEVAEDVLGSSDERNGKDDWVDLSDAADSSGCVCAIALLTTHANGLNRAANLQIHDWPQKSQLDHTQACVSQILTIPSMYSSVRAQQPRRAPSEPPIQASQPTMHE